MGGSTTQTQTSDFGETAKPFAKDLLSQAKGLNQSGVGFNPYQGQTLADQSFGTQFGIQSGLNTAMQGNPLVGQAMGATANTLGRGGLSFGQRAASNFFGNMAAGGNNLDTSAYSRFTQPSQAQDLMMQTAQGNFLNGSPYLDKMINDSNANIAQRVNESMSAAGRYGSGAHTKQLTDALASNANNAYLSNYQQERANQLNAINGVSGMDAQQLNALNSMYGAEQQNIANQITGAGNLASIGQQGIGNQQNAIGQLGAINDARYADATKALGFGTMQDQYSQAQLDDAAARYQAQESAPWNRLNAYGSFINPLLGMNQVKTGVQSGGNGFGQVAGGLLAGLSLLSDRRAKTDIRPVGKLDNGLPVYSYKYKGDGATHIGLMADEVTKVRPEAITKTSTYDYVDYSKAVL